MADDASNLPVVYAETIEAPSVDELASVAERIRSREQAVRDGAFAYLRNGADLSAVKRQLGHGAFIPWCEREFGGTLGWSVRTIERMMLAADAVGDKIDAVTNLKVTKSIVYAVTAPSTPNTIRQDFLQRISAGDSSAPADALAAIKAAKVQSYADAARERMTPDARAAAEKRRAAATKRHERELAKRDTEEAERKTFAAQAVALLRDRLGSDVDAFAELADRAGYGFAGLVRALREFPPDPPLVVDEPDPETVAPPPVDHPTGPRRGAASLDRYGAFGRTRH